MTTRDATHPPAVPVVERATEGGSGGDLANGPRGTRNRTPDDNDAGGRRILGENVPAGVFYSQPVYLGHFG